MLYYFLAGCLMIVLLTPMVISGLEPIAKLTILYTTGLAFLHTLLYSGYYNIMKNKHVATRISWRYFMFYLSLGIGLPMMSSLINVKEEHHLIIAILMVLGLFINNLYLVRDIPKVNIVVSTLYGSSLTLAVISVISEEFEWAQDNAVLSVSMVIVFFITTIISSKFIEWLANMVSARR